MKSSTEGTEDATCRVVENTDLTQAGVSVHIDISVLNRRETKAAPERIKGDTADLAEGETRKWVVDEIAVEIHRVRSGEKSARVRKIPDSASGIISNSEKRISTVCCE